MKVVGWGERGEVVLLASSDRSDPTDPEPRSDSEDPIEALLRRKELRWYLHRKDPVCVVGEHKQFPFWLVCFWKMGFGVVDVGVPVGVVGLSLLSCAVLSLLFSISSIFFFFGT